MRSVVQHTARQRTLLQPGAPHPRPVGADIGAEPSDTRLPRQLTRSRSEPRSHFAVV
jgi:hypothetical protein